MLLKHYTETIKLELIVNHFRSQTKQKGWRRFSLGFNTAAPPAAVVGEKEGLKSSTSLQYLPEDIQDMGVGPASQTGGSHPDKDMQTELNEDTERKGQNNEDKEHKKLLDMSVSHEYKDRSGNSQHDQGDPVHEDLPGSNVAQQASEVDAEQKHAQEEPQALKEPDKEKALSSEETLSEVKGNAEASGCTLGDIREHDHDDAQHDDLHHHSIAMESQQLRGEDTFGQSDLPSLNTIIAFRYLVILPPLV